MRLGNEWDKKLGDDDQMRVASAAGGDGDGVDEMKLVAMRMQSTEGVSEEDSDMNCARREYGGPQHEGHHFRKKSGVQLVKGRTREQHNESRRGRSRPGLEHLRATIERDSPLCASHLTPYCEWLLLDENDVYRSHDAEGI